MLKDFQDEKGKSLKKLLLNNAKPYRTNIFIYYFTLFVCFRQYTYQE